MNIEDQANFLIKDDDIDYKIKNAKDTIITNLVEVNNKSKSNFLKLNDIANKLLDEIIEDFKSLDIKEKIKLWEKIQNIMLASKEIDVDLINPKNNIPSVIFTSEEKQKDNIDKFIDNMPSDVMRKIDDLIKLLNKN